MIGSGWLVCSAGAQVYRIERAPRVQGEAHDSPANTLVNRYGDHTNSERARVTEYFATIEDASTYDLHMVMMIDPGILLRAVETEFTHKRPELERLMGAVSIADGQVLVDDHAGVAEGIGVLPYLAAFGSDEVRQTAHHAAWEIAKVQGIYCASIDALYRQIAAGSLSGFTVPAMNMRAIAFESARGVFQAMLHHKVGAAIFELSRGEIGFTSQRPREYSTAILCAAIAEGYSGPVFLQGDHFQISASRFAASKNTELLAVKALIAEAVDVGFYNIDIDTSTLVDLSCVSIDDQQQPNVQLSAELAAFARGIEPAGITLSLGGEIGEVGEHNSTIEELDAYLGGYRRAMHRLLNDDTCAGLTKISVQTGTRHGGNILADGSVGEMNVDFELIDALSARCRSEFGVAGCVQHGASMLSLAKISQLPKAGCIEVHLAAAFLNIVYEHLPSALVQQADDWLKAEFKDEWKPGWSEPQFLHHARRYPIGPNKRAWWDSDPSHEKLRADVSRKAAEYFIALKVCDTHDTVSNIVPPMYQPWVPPADHGLDSAADESSIGDLAS